MRGESVNGASRSRWTEVRDLRHEPSGDSEVSDEIMWWPPHKVAGRELANYLARRTELAAT